MGAPGTLHSYQHSLWSVYTIQLCLPSGCAVIFNPVNSLPPMPVDTADTLRIAYPLVSLLTILRVCGSTFKNLWKVWGLPAGILWSSQLTLPPQFLSMTLPNFLFWYSWAIKPWTLTGEGQRVGSALLSLSQQIKFSPKEILKAAFIQSDRRFARGRKCNDKSSFCWYPGNLTNLDKLLTCTDRGSRHNWSAHNFCYSRCAVFPTPLSSGLTRQKRAPILV